MRRAPQQLGPNPGKVAPEIPHALERPVSPISIPWRAAAAALLLFSLPAQAGAAALATSGALTGGAPAQRLTFDVTNVKTLVLAATGYSWGQAVWGEPVLLDKDGRRTLLTALTPLAAHVGWGQFAINHGPDHKPLSIGGRAFAFGLFAHADSEVVYDLAGRFTRFEAWVGINHTAEKRGRVIFEIRSAEDWAWHQTLAQLRHGFTRDCLASLHHALAGGSHSAALDTRLAGFDQAFDGLRRALDDNPEPVRPRLTEFIALVREIRTLKLDAPLLFNRRQPYFSGHIYDDHLTWHPGGGFYILENPAAPPEQQVVRPLLDAQTKATPGAGVYRDPDLSFDAQRMLFAFKGEAHGDTAIFEIALDGTRLRRLTDPARDHACRDKPAGLIGEGGHDYSPCYLPDGRIAFVSTRTAGLVMCFNNHIATLHTMNADGSDLKNISVNNVTEFDPTVLPDGRLLYGRWEYVDKTALYMQSLWTINPDGTQETALFKNNLAKPTAVLDARPVPGSDLIVATLTPHNGQSVGAIAMLDPRLGKNNLAALTNFTPEYPTEMDQGLTRGPCDPWPLDADTVLIANNAPEHGAHGVIELVDRYGFRFVIRREPDISCYAPMLIKPTPVPPVRPSQIQPGEPAKFFVRDIYQGLDGVARGTVKVLRVLETTSRVSGIPRGGRWWNQAFLVSWQGSYDVKNFLGIVPVAADGSAYFVAPPGKALYFQALDQDGHLVQSMRTFVQAAPGVTRSCQGCHIKDDDLAAVAQTPRALALQRPAAQLQPEPWGRGYLDYPTLVQPVLDRHCAGCHGGARGIGAGLDFSGGWTWAFNLSYETLLKNTLTGFLNCNNGSVRTAEILPPRTHGSGAERLGHNLKELAPAERALLLAWMDGNCNYYGTWDFSDNATCDALLAAREPLLGALDAAGCVHCHPRELGSDWINLQTPEHSRILRAPLAKTQGGTGLAWCRDRKAQPVQFPLISQKNQPPDVFRPAHWAALNAQGAAVTPFANTEDPHYLALLALIQQTRTAALKSPRVDMPGAEIIRGRCRELAPLTPPAPATGN